MTQRRSIATALAFVLPLLIVVVGAIVAASRPRQESDWLGLGHFFPFLVALVLAALVAVVISAVAFFRREPRAAVSLIGAVPAALVIAAVIAFVSTGFYRDLQVEKHQELVARLVADPALRQRLVSQQPLDTPSTRALLSYEARDLLTQAQVERIWEQRKDVDLGQHYESLIGPAYSPERVLREYFDRLMAAEMRRSGERSYRSLVYHVTLLRHRNLPQDIIDEILADGDPDLVLHLQHNPRLTSDPARLKRWADVPPQ